MTAMLFALADQRNGASWAARLRKRRFAFFRELLARLPRPVSICDVGGTTEFWRGVSLPDEDDVSVTVVNLEQQPSAGGRIRTLVGDARALPFAARSFDVVYSNSVIEHVGTFADQRRMAQEVRRVAPRYFVQTPSYFFPIEPHFLVPGFQFLPLDVRAALLMRRRLGWVAKAESMERAREEVRSVRLLRCSQVRALFPDARIYREKLFGLTKSYVAYGGW
ncbi:MAG: class I SAM-dependent methyltransferase [Vulcanimicrobiaceae bacterium]|jgi:hypothetical protein